MKKINLFVITLLLFAFNAQAQHTWTWDSYGISIDLPEDFEVVTNTDETFEAAGEGMEIMMYIFEEDISLDELDDATHIAAEEMELEEIDAIQNVTVDGLEGKYIAGYKDGDAVLLVGLLDPDSDVNFFVVITFNDDDPVAEEDAMHILDSISRT